MQKQRIEYFHNAEKLIGELLISETGPAQRPTIIVFHAFEGRGQFTVEYAAKLAEHGFAVFVADMYGNAQIADTIDGCFQLVKPFLQDRQLVRTRALLAYDAIKAHPQVDSNRIGALGFCFGGMCVLELARSGANLWAGVTMHGVLAKSDLPTQSITSKLLILHGYEDPQVPPTELERFAKEMAAANVKDWTFAFFGGAKHSFTDPRTGTFDPPKEREVGREYHRLAAERSFRYALDFFQE